MRTIPIFQIGAGGVGRALIEQVSHFNQYIAPRYDLRFEYAGLVDRSGVVTDLDPLMLAEALELKRAGGSLSHLPQGQATQNWPALLPSAPCIVVDVTAQDGMDTPLVQAVADGHCVVLANKKPLCASYDHWIALTEAQRTRYEATVGAGLPVISTLRLLLDTGDTVQSIEGCLSGTLGFLMSEIERGVTFADAVIDARQRGWTEPDPRDDLSGMDVARKALILARTCGIPADLVNVSVEPLYPQALADVSLEEFLVELPMMNEQHREQYVTASGEGMTLRYVARVNAEEQHVGLTAVDKASPVGGLQGPDNLVVYHTGRYNQLPLSIRGPGAGTAVTASAVLGDMLAFALQWC